MFWARVNKDTLNGCWLWMGSTSGEGKGYGSVEYNGRQLLAHRVSFEMANGPIPNGLLVLHECDESHCVNPAHLYLGTNKDNTRDAMLRGRHRVPAGENHPRAKLNNSKAAMIRKLYRPHIVTKAMLAKQFGVSAGTIANVVNGHNWKQENGEEL